MNVSMGLLLANGVPFHIKGVEWRGSEGINMAPGGLEHHSVDF